MSISVGTVGGRRGRRSVWPVVFLAVVLMTTAALVVFTLSREGPRTAPTGAATEVSDVVVGTATGTAANTPSEVRGRYASAVDPSRIEPQAVPGAGGGWVVSGNTPTELSGGIPAQIRARHQLG